MRFPLLRRREQGLPAPPRGEMLGVLELSAEDQRQFAELHTKHAGRFVRLARRFLDRDEAEDVVAEAMVQLWAQWRSLPPELRTARYAYGIVRHGIFARLKKDAPDARLDDHELDIEVASVRAHDEAIIDADAAQRDARVSEVFDEVVAAMPPRQREVVLLIHQNELSYQDAAEELGIAKGSVCQHMSRALRTLRKALVRAGITGVRDVLKCLPAPRGGHTP